MRYAEITRRTAETQITLTLNLDGRGESSVETGCGFLDHMLTLFARHGRFDLTVECVGDTHVDNHHTVEDVGICLGMAFTQALGEKKGIERYGSCTLPMDETLVTVAVDLSGRSYLGCALDIPAQKVGTFDTELVAEFFFAFVRSCPCALHLRQLAGINSHHIIEGTFKAFGRTLRQAVKINADFAEEVPSTKGVL